MRWGIIGWGTRTGIGTINWSFWRTGKFDRWLMPLHPEPGVPLAGEPGPGVTVCQLRDRQALDEFLGDIDGLFFTERPFFDNCVHLFAKARKRGLKVVCEPVAEWIPPYFTPWLQQVDVMFGPTAHTLPVLRQVADEAQRAGVALPWRHHIVGGRWGIEIDRWPARQRGRCRRFLFCNGGGGCLGRKGLAVVLEAAALAKRCSVLIRSQVPIPQTLPPNVEVRIENLADQLHLYDDGDVLLAPSMFEGFGYSLYEAQACGMPVITTDFAPMNECGTEYLIRADKGQYGNLAGRQFEYALPSATSLACLMDLLNGMDLTLPSARAYQRSRAWSIGEVVDDIQRYVAGL